MSVDSVLQVGWQARCFWKGDKWSWCCLQSWSRRYSRRNTQKESDGSGQWWAPTLGGHTLVIWQGIVMMWFTFRLEVAKTLTILKCVSTPVCFREILQHFNVWSIADVLCLELVSVVCINFEFQLGALRLLKRLANRVLNVMYMLSFTNPHWPP